MLSLGLSGRGHMGQTCVERARVCAAPYSRPLALWATHLGEKSASTMVQLFWVFYTLQLITDSMDMNLSKLREIKTDREACPWDHQESDMT